MATLQFNEKLPTIHEITELLIHEAIKRNDGGYSVEFDIPLNGEVSDLTAQLEFNKKGRVFEVVLHDIHVL